MSREFKTKARAALQDIKPYKPGKPIEEVKRELGIDDVIKLASNENPLGPSPKALSRMQEAVGRVNLYPDGTCYYLKNAIAGKRGIQPSEVLVGNGSDEVIKLLAETFINPGDNAVMADPSFSEYEFAVTLMAGSLRKIPLTADFRHDLDAMRDAVDEKTRMVFLCNPNNPTGTIVTRDAVDRFLAELPEHVVVVFDEAYHEYADSPEYPRGIEYVKQGWKNIIVLHTFSKIYGLAGLRVGYGVASEEMLDWVTRTREPFNVNSIAQAGALGALADDEHVERSRRVNREGADYLYGALEEMGLACTKTYANFLWVDAKVDCVALFGRLLKQGVIVRTGDVFGYNDYIRITIGTMEENRRLVETLRAVLHP